MTSTMTKMCMNVEKWRYGARGDMGKRSYMRMAKHSGIKRRSQILYK